ncbi:MULTISPECIES: MFS transporter [unclassified Streptomyces]|uniref:MFS transporter n=1 Tax=unclassified Streptomyces TaxID=2593676 RepID=UPI00381281AF
MNRRLTLAGSVVGAMVVALDGTVLTIARPTLQQDLGASLVEAQWTGTGYLIAVAGLLVFAGRLGDRYGQQRLFGIGMVGFGLTSAAIGLAPDVGWVIGLRVVQGVFGALLQPATLGMLRAAYPPDRLRMPIAVRTSSIGLAAAAGPVLGGALAAGPGWRAVFFLNVVPTLLLGGLALVTRDPGGRPAPRPVPLDVPGVVLLAVALACLTHALVALPAGSWAVAALGVVAAVAFVAHERRAASPLVPSDVIGQPSVAAALGVLVAASAALNGTLFVAAYLLQDTFGLDPVQTGLRALPLAAAMILAAPLAAVLPGRFGPRVTTVTASGVLAAGILVLRAAHGTPAVCTGFALIGAGFGTVMVTATHVVVRRAPVGSAGVAGGLQQTAMNVGPTLGVAGAATLTGAGGGHAVALGALAGVAGVAVLIGRLLPKRSELALHPDQPEDRAPVPERR